MYLVFLENRAKKVLRKVDKNIQKRILKNLHLLESNPFLGSKMHGEFQGYYRVKIPPLRIIYLPDIKNKIIKIRVIGFRGDIYKKSLI